MISEYTSPNYKLGKKKLKKLTCRFTASDIKNRTIFQSA
jgi:hypothetical protein